MTQSNENSQILENSTSFIQGLQPKKSEIKYTIGPYQILKEIGKGGMGEVLLAYDTKCGRRIALKKIRADLIEHKKMQDRFLKEARITSQLTHPAIMPIYVIEDENGVVYYTMPFVQGENLKRILLKTREQEKKGEELHHLGGSIPALVRVFITVCHAIAYAHSNGVIHRDIKPENIIIGKFGEVIILDWGLAKIIGEADDDLEVFGKKTTKDELTQVGKVVGTINYMAPERATGKEASVQTEIYALGVMLYQILTLCNPFYRKSLEEFKKIAKKEKIVDPTVIAPYRDVPRLLAQIALKCLEFDPKKRFKDVESLIRELENYIEGRSEWFQIAKLDPKKKTDWEFQENVLILEHIAIKRSLDVSEWVNLMISKASFTENTKIEAKVTIGKKNQGLGFLLSVPEAVERVHLNDGYCLWLGTQNNKTTKLLRSTVEVIDAPEIFLESGKTYHIRIEKVDHSIYFYLNDSLQFSYITQVPLVGTHIGLVTRDADYKLEDFYIYVGGQNITVNCLAVPDAFLANKDYAKALIEYRRIGYSFPGRAEGREAQFRAGITILEEAKNEKQKKKKRRLFELSLQEFEKLHLGPGAPLEYLGKALCYQTMNDKEDEIKCYELAFRRYSNHPLLPLLQEHLIYRMHECSRLHRKTTYKFVLTAIRHLSEKTISRHTKKLMNSLQQHWENLPFIEDDASFAKQLFGIKLAFWTANPHALTEYIDELFKVEKMPIKTIANALFCLIELGAYRAAKGYIKKLGITNQPEIDLLNIAIVANEKGVNSVIGALKKKPFAKAGLGISRLIIYLMELSIEKKQLFRCSSVLRSC